VEEDLSIDLVVVILDDEAICAIKKSIAADVSIELLKKSKALSNVYASLGDYSRMLLKSVAS
jgi:hypothetical protein